MPDNTAEQKFTILGCSSSPGVPRVNGDWGACDPSNPKNRRRRASFLIEQTNSAGETTTIVIDTGPDFREQMLSANVKNIDAVLYTHAHADHIHGIDDLRSFALANKRRVDIYANQPTMAQLEACFGYCIKTPEGSQYPPIVTANLISDIDTPLTIDGGGGAVQLELIDQVHGSIRSIGARVGNIAYCSDVSAFPDASLEKLQNLDVLVIDATLPWEHPSHFSLDQALEQIEIIKPKRAILTHMHTPLDYDAVMAQTPDHVEPAYDGLVFTQILSS